MKSVIIVIATLVVGILTGYVVGNDSYNTVHYPHKVVHQYDYILEVDGTDSVEHIFLYDNKHNPVGDFYTNNPDSLQIIIDANTSRGKQ